MHLNREITVGNLLTIATIIISVVSVLLSWKADRDLRREVEIAKIRQAAALSLSNLERAREISMSMFDAVQDDYVETTELVADLAARRAESRPDDATTMVHIEARDYLWKRINAALEQVRQARLADRIETGYQELLSYYPSVRAIYVEALVAMEAAERDMAQQLLAETERAILRPQTAPSETAVLGNKLRGVSSAVQTAYEQQLDSIFSAAERFHVALIDADDGYLATRQRPLVPK